MPKEVHVVEKVSLHIELKSDGKLLVSMEGWGNINDASKSYCVYLGHHGAEAIKMEMQRLDRARTQNAGMSAGGMLS